MNGKAYMHVTYNSNCYVNAKGLLRDTGVQLCCKRGKYVEDRATWRRCFLRPLVGIEIWPIEWRHFQWPWMTFRVTFNCCKLFQIWFFRKFCSIWQYFNWHRRTCGPSATAESLVTGPPTHSVTTGLPTHSVFTGPPTHIVGVRLVTLAGVCCHLSGSVTLHGGPAGGFTGAGQSMTSCHLQSNCSSTVTLHGGPVVLRPVRPTPCFIHLIMDCTTNSSLWCIGRHQVLEHSEIRVCQTTSS